MFYVSLWSFSFSLESNQVSIIYVAQYYKSRFTRAALILVHKLITLLPSALEL